MNPRDCRPVMPTVPQYPTTIVINNGQYRWVAVQQKDKRVWLVKEYSGYRSDPIRTYAVHDENIVAEVRKTIGTAEV